MPPYTFLLRKSINKSINEKPLRIMVRMCFSGPSGHTEKAAATNLATSRNKKV